MMDARATAIVLAAGVVAASLSGCRGERSAADTVATVGAPAVPPDSASAGAAAPLDSAATALHGAATPAATEFLRYADTLRTTGTLTVPGAPDSALATHDVAAEAVHRLAAAIASLAAADTTLGVAGDRLDALRARADSLQRGAPETEHARLASEAFALGGDLLLRLPERGPPALTDRAGEVRQAAAAIRTDRPLAGQIDAVRRFVERCAAALRGKIGATTS